MSRRTLRPAVGFLAASALLATTLVWGARVSARTSAEQIILAVFAPSSIRGYHFDGGIVTDDLDPRTPDTKVYASLDLNRMLVASDRYILSANLFTGLGLVVVDRATGVELPRPRTTQNVAQSVLVSPDGRFGYALGTSPTGQNIFSVIDLRAESATFDTEIKTVTLTASANMIGMTVDPTGTRVLILETVSTPTPPSQHLVTVDVTTPPAAAVIKDTLATEPLINAAPGFEAAGAGRLHTFSTGGSNYLLVPRRQTQIYKINADGSLTYVQTLTIPTGNLMRDAVFATTGGANRVYALSTRTATPFTVSVIAFDMTPSGAGFTGTNLGAATIDTLPAAAEGTSQIAASLDGSRLYLARAIPSLPSTLVAVDAAAVVTSPAAAVLATESLGTLAGTTAVGIAVVAPVNAAAQPTVTGVAVDGTPNAVLVNNATHTITVSGTNLANTHQAFIGLTRATVVSASANSVTITSPLLVPANTASIVVLGNDGSAAGTITVANPADYFPSYVVYASSSGTNRITVLNAATGTSVVRQFDSGQGATDATSTADGRFLVAGNFRGNGVTIHSVSDDPAHGFTADQIVAQPSFGATVQRVVTSPARKRAYAASLNDVIGIIDTDADSPTFGTTVGTIALPATSQTRAVAISPDGNHLYITRIGAPQLLVADVSTDTVPTPAQFTLAGSGNGRADGLALSPDGTRLYFMNAGDTVMRIFDTTSPASPVQVGTVSLPGALIGDVHRIQVLPNNRFVYVASRQKAAVDVFDVALNSFVASVPTGAFSNDPAVSRNSNYVFVGVAENDAVLTIDARELVNGLPNPRLHHIVAATGGGVGVTSTSVTGGIATGGGTNITVVPQPGVSVTFANVTTPGLTTATAANVSDVPLPPFYFNPGVPVYVSIESSAVFNGGVTVCLAYSDVGLTAAQEGAVRVLHLEGGSYVDVTSTTDAGGNIACGGAADLGQFVVAFYDGSAPVVTAPASQIIGATSPGGAVATFDAPTAVDALSGVASLTCDHASGETFPLGTTLITCTATDRVGRTGSATFTITVDGVPPVLTLPAGFTVTAPGVGATVTFTATAIDNIDGSVPVICTPASGAHFDAGATTVNCTASDSHGNSSAGSFVVTVVNNRPPVCTAAAPSIASIWPANHQMVAVNILGVTDPDGTVATITITAILQDEPVNSGGDGNTNVDGTGVNSSTAQVRAERSGQGNGRFYHIRFTATDPAGATCTGEVKVVVPKSQGKNDVPVDGGPLYDSTAAPLAIKEHE